MRRLEVANRVFRCFLGGLVLLVSKPTKLRFRVLASFQTPFSLNYMNEKNEWRTLNFFIRGRIKIKRTYGKIQRK